ncbi:MAG: amylo-alpha-1,6-glucosidase, partial [Thermomicrobiaceae bacterium]|nr:amylo-alpha-1,6-glucosidase [Thermomicrobiaceae bacterium]
ADLARAWERALRDLAALEIPLDSGHVVPAAGLPWFLAIFGRDAIVASWQTFLLGPRAAQGTLEALAAYQAEADDAFRDAEPGKIPHEIRFGELAVSGAIPHAAYYGSIDATPLWVALLGEYLRWTGDLPLVERLLPAAERAVAWIDRHGDLDGDGLLEYRRRSSWGLENQGWKDSSDSVRFADGRLAEPPIALVEVQGYAYAAKQTLADLYETVGRVEDGARLRAEARELRRRIHDAFWLPREGYYALALDGRKRPVDSVTSNPGHLLWAGAVEEPYAGMVAERLLAPDLFTGWGVRTMSAEMAAYSPISYHNGSVWPHDNALIVAGLRRYGYDVAASAIAEGLIAATRWFDEHRLPELFCGYDRRRTPFPVNYPVACAPQAWAAGSVVLLVQELAGIRPGEGGIAGRPLPQDRALALRGVPWRGRRYDVRVPGR